MQPLYIGTILLEKNRWTTRIPTIRVSDWVERFRQDGFSGIELWENHFLLQDKEEREALRSSEFPVGVYNSYLDFDNWNEDQAAETAQVIRDLKVPAVKYNLGKDPSRLEDYILQLNNWAELLPEECRILCECHPGTVMEEPENAAAVFRQLMDPRHQAVIHAPGDPEAMEKWFQALGSRISHVHIQLRNNHNELLKLKEDPRRVRLGVEVLKRHGYAGSFTIEFTRGVRMPDENPEDLYACARDDLQYLKETLALDL